MGQHSKNNKSFVLLQWEWNNCVTGLPTVVKLVDKETLMKEKEDKKRVREQLYCFNAFQEGFISLKREVGQALITLKKISSSKCYCSSNIQKDYTNHMENVNNLCVVDYEAQQNKMALSSKKSWMKLLIWIHHTRTVPSCRVQIWKSLNSFPLAGGRREAKEEGRGRQEEARTRGQAQKLRLTFYLSSARH